MKEFPTTFINQKFCIALTANIINSNYNHFYFYAKGLDKINYNIHNINNYFKNLELDIFI